MKTSGHRSLEKYTSHFIERVVYERELETEQNCNILTRTLMAITAFLTRSPGLLNWGPSLIPASSLQLIWGSELHLLNRVSWGPPLLGAGSLYSILYPTNSNFQCTELYYCFTSTQFNLSTVKVIPLRPSTGCSCYLHRCISYFYSSAGVNMQKNHTIIPVFVHFIHHQLSFNELVRTFGVIKKRSRLYFYTSALFSFLPSMQQ